MGSVALVQGFCDRSRSCGGTWDDTKMHTSDGGKRRLQNIVRRRESAVKETYERQEYARLRCSSESC